MVYIWYNYNNYNYSLHGDINLDVIMSDVIDKREGDWKRKYPQSTIRISPRFIRGLFPTWKLKHE